MPGKKMVVLNKFESELHQKMKANAAKFNRTIAEEYEKAVVHWLLTH